MINYFPTARGRRKKEEGKRENGKGKREKGKGKREREKGKGKREKGKGKREKEEGRRKKAITSGVLSPVRLNYTFKESIYLPMAVMKLSRKTSWQSSIIACPTHTQQGSLTQICIHRSTAPGGVCTVYCVHNLSCYEVLIIWDNYQLIRCLHVRIRYIRQGIHAILCFTSHEEVEQRLNSSVLS